MPPRRRSGFLQLTMSPRRFKKIHRPRPPRWLLGLQHWLTNEDPAASRSTTRSSTPTIGDESIKQPAQDIIAIPSPTTTVPVIEPSAEYAAPSRSQTSPTVSEVQEQSPMSSSSEDTTTTVNRSTTSQTWRSCRLSNTRSTKKSRNFLCWIVGSTDPQPTQDIIATTVPVIGPSAEYTAPSRSQTSPTVSEVQEQSPISSSSEDTTTTVNRSTTPAQDIIATTVPVIEPSAEYTAPSQSQTSPTVSEVQEQSPMSSSLEETTTTANRSTTDHIRNPFNEAYISPTRAHPNEEPGEKYAEKLLDSGSHSKSSATRRRRPHLVGSMDEDEDEEEEIIMSGMFPKSTASKEIREEIGVDSKPQRKGKITEIEEGGEESGKTNNDIKPMDKSTSNASKDTSKVPMKNVSTNSDKRKINVGRVDSLGSKMAISCRCCSRSKMNLQCSTCNKFPMGSGNQKLVFRNLLDPTSDPPSPLRAFCQYALFLFIYILLGITIYTGVGFSFKDYKIINTNSSSCNATTTTYNFPGTLDTMKSDNTTCMATTTNYSGAGYAGNRTSIFVDGLYFSVVTTWRIGYGDIIPVTPATKILACVYVLGAAGLLEIIVTEAILELVHAFDSMLITRMCGLRGIGRGKAHLSHMMFAFIYFLICIGVGSFFLHAVEKMDWLDAIYSSVISASTAGYGDKTFEKKSGRVFASFWLPISSFSLSYLIFLVASVWTGRRSWGRLARMIHITSQKKMTAAAMQDPLRNAEFIFLIMEKVGRMDRREIEMFRKYIKELYPEDTGRHPVEDAV